MAPAYPYKTKDDYFSVLEAVDFEDAKQHLFRCCGHGVKFCETVMSVTEFRSAMDDPEGAFEYWAERVPVHTT